MPRLICCDYHEASESVELRYTDGTLIDIDCLRSPGTATSVPSWSGCSITTRLATPIWF